MENAPLADAESTAELTRFRDERKMLSFVLIGGDRIEGAIRWFDSKAIHIVTPEREELTLFRSGVLYYRLAR